MTRNKIDALLRSLFTLKSDTNTPPTQSNWNELVSFFGASFPDEFISFMELAGNHYIEGGLLRIADDGNIRGKDTIISSVEAEKSLGSWPDDLIPFYSVGNGDYYCISKERDTPVLYLYHEDHSVEVLHDSFELFLENELPDFV